MNDSTQNTSTQHAPREKSFSDKKPRFGGEKPKFGDKRNSDSRNSRAGGRDGGGFRKRREYHDREPVQDNTPAPDYSGETAPSAFDVFELPNVLKHALERLNFTNPTPIQEATIPIGLAGKDVLGTAQTGTGKTAAFVIPLICHILKNETATGLILLPTRELATQVISVVHDFLGYRSPIKTALLIGGDSLTKQFMQLRAHPRIVVGTPGRVIDHVQRQTVDLSNASMLVLDETDRMLDMGFGVQLDEIIESLPQTRQTLMFSATLPQNILRLSRKYLSNPERMEMGGTNVVATQIQQEIIRTPESGKYKALLEELQKREGTCIIFVKTKINCDRLADKLDADGFQAAPIHGDLRQRERDRVVRDFRSQRFQILVATDVAARGLDIPHIAHVINYDLPQCPEDYIHRLGRTARAGAEGNAVSFIAPDDNAKWRAIHRLLHPNERLEGFEGGSEGKRGGNRRGGGGNGSYGQSRGNGGGERKPYGRDGGFSREAGNRSERPARSFDGERTPRPVRSFDGDRPARSNDAPREPRKFDGDRPQRSEFAPKRFEGNSERPARKFDGERSERPVRSFDTPREPRKFDGERPARKFDGGKSSFVKPAGAAPAKKYGTSNAKPNLAGNLANSKFDKPKFNKPKLDVAPAQKRERKIAW